MIKHPIRLLPFVLVGSLVAVSCGGSDEEQAGDETAVAVDDAPAVPGSGGEEETDSDGAGTNDQAQDALDEAEVDLDLDELEEDIGELGTGEGGGVVTIDGVAYTFEATAVCLAQGDDFVAEGVGTDPDGNPAWVSISASHDDLDGDGTEGPTIDVAVVPGKTELFGGGADDAPDFWASYGEGFVDASQEVVYELDGSRISGSGAIQDFNGVAIPYGELREMTFEASCD